MYTKARTLVSPWMFAALSGCLLSAAVANASTLDRYYQFGDDSFETGVAVGAPITFFGTTVDSESNGGSAFHDLNTSDGTATGPKYADTDATGGSNRPGARATEFGVSFDGVNDHLFIDGAFSSAVGVGSGGLGIPSQADGQATYGAVVNWTGINNRYMSGWVRPTNAAAAGRQDIIADTSQFSIHITGPTPTRVWAMSHGDPGGNTGTTPGSELAESTVPVAFNSWTHVMQRSFSGDAVLYVNGVGVAWTTNNSDTTPEDPTATANNNYNMVFGAGVNKTSNFFAGELDEWRLGVEGNNSTTAAAGGLPAGMNWGNVDMAVDNDFIKQTLDAAGNKLGDVNLDGVVDINDVNEFKSNWLKTYSLNNFQFGDLNSRMDGDFTFNGVINLNDAIVLRNGLIAAGAGALFDLSDLVPEPTSMLLAVFGLVSLVGVRRRRG